MSTSDQDRATDFSTTGFPTGFDDALKPALPVEQTTVAGSLPDVTTLARMANEFFRAQPGQGFPTSVAPTELSSRADYSAVDESAVHPVAAVAMPTSPFSLPMPEFDQALFPSFE